MFACACLCVSRIWVRRTLNRESYAYRYAFFFVFLWFSFSSFILVVSRLRGPFRKREVHTCPHSQERKSCVSWFFSFLVNIVHRSIFTHFTNLFRFLYLSQWHLRKESRSLLSSYTSYGITPLIRITLQVHSAIMNSPLSCATKSYIIEKYHRRYLYYTTNSYLFLPSANRNTHFQSISHGVRLLYLYLYLYIYITLSGNFPFLYLT